MAEREKRESVDAVREMQLKKACDRILGRASGATPGYGRPIKPGGRNAAQKTALGLGPQQHLPDRPCQFRDVPLNDIAENRRIHLIVGVNQQIPRADNASPGHFHMNLLEFGVELRRCLSDDFQVPAHCVHHHGRIPLLRSQVLRVAENPLSTPGCVADRTADLWLP